MMVHGIMFQKFDPRAAYFDPVIDMLKDTGLMSHFFDKLMPPKNMRESIPHSEEPLVPDHFYLPSIVWLCGLALALIFHTIEHSLTNIGLRKDRRKAGAQLKGLGTIREETSLENTAEADAMALTCGRFMH